jgi:hypothetical protein
MIITRSTVGLAATLLSCPHRGHSKLVTGDAHAVKATDTPEPLNSTPGGIRVSPCGITGPTFSFSWSSATALPRVIDMNQKAAKAYPTCFIKRAVRNFRKIVYSFILTYHYENATSKMACRARDGFSPRHHQEGCCLGHHDLIQSNLTVTLCWYLGSGSMIGWQRCARGSSVSFFGPLVFLSLLRTRPSIANGIFCRPEK